MLLPSTERSLRIEPLKEAKERRERKKEEEKEGKQEGKKDCLRFNGFSDEWSNGETGGNKDGLERG